nr:DUF2262 domain-containing protein [Flavobacterium sp. ASV13]
MYTITKENLKVNPNIENAYQTIVTINEQKIKISLDPDDVEIEKTIELANKIMGNFDFYEKKARQKIIEEYLNSYNEDWREEEEGEVKLDEKSFSKNLTLKSVSFLSDSCIDFFYSENGMFGNHSLIAQSFDGENFDDATMFG